MYKYIIMHTLAADMRTLKALVLVSKSFNVYVEELYPAILRAQLDRIEDIKAQEYDQDEGPEAAPMQEPDDNSTRDYVKKQRSAIVELTELLNLGLVEYMYDTGRMPKIHIEHDQIELQMSVTLKFVVLPNHNNAIELNIRAGSITIARWYESDTMILIHKITNINLDKDISTDNAEPMVLSVILKVFPELRCYI